MPLRYMSYEFKAMKKTSSVQVRFPGSLHALWPIMWCLAIAESAIGVISLSSDTPGWLACIAVVVMLLMVLITYWLMYSKHPKFLELYRYGWQDQDVSGGCQSNVETKVKLNDIKNQVLVVLSSGEKRWKQLEVIHRGVPQDRQDVRNAIATLMDEGKVTANMDPTDGSPVYALVSRL